MDEKLKKLIIVALGIAKINLTERSVESIVQFIKFGIVGVSNTILSYVLNVIVLVLLNSLEVAWDYIAGNIVSFILSVLWSFYWNNRFVFTAKEGERRSVFKTLMKTYVSYGVTGIVLNNILSWIWINLFHISKFVAPLINLIVSVPLNYVINRFWTFKSEKGRT